MRFHVFWLLFLILSVASCTKIKDLFNPPGPRELYSREFNEENPRFREWDAAFEESMNDSLAMLLPYRQTGRFYANDVHAYSYNIDLEQGEIFNFELITDSVNARVFIDFFRKTDDGPGSYELVKQLEPTDRILQFEVEQSDTYKIVVQPSLDVQTVFAFMGYTLPKYSFPLAGYDNSAIKSFWGQERDAGRRRHEGIDIFAPRGTPVTAVTDGRVSYTGERGLGGKQVWVRTGMVSGHSLYYAHLDSITVSDNESVNRGDTLGFVGNSGNAITTSPHLHFGIYGGRGAVNPLPFVLERNRPELPEINNDPEKRELIVHSQIANLRTAASMQGKKIGEARQGDTLQYLGTAGNWRKVKTGDEMKAFVHESLVE